MGSIYQEYGIEATIFILVTLICLFLLHLSDLTSIIVGVLGAGLTYLIKRGKVTK